MEGLAVERPDIELIPPNGEFLPFVKVELRFLNALYPALHVPVEAHKKAFLGLLILLGCSVTA